MIKFEVGKRYYFNGYMDTMHGECVERETFGMIDFVDYPKDQFENRETVFLNWHDKLYASDSRWWAK